MGVRLWLQAARQFGRAELKADKRQISALLLARQASVVLQPQTRGLSPCSRSGKMTARDGRRVSWLKSAAKWRFEDAMPSLPLSRRELLTGTGAAMAAALSWPSAPFAASNAYVSRMDLIRQEGISPEDEDHDLNILNGDDAAPAWRSMVANGMADGIRKFKGRAGGLYRINSRDGDAAYGVVFPGSGSDWIEIDLQGSRVMGRIAEAGNFSTFAFRRVDGAPTLHLHNGIIDLSEGHTARPGRGNRPGLNGISISQLWTIQIHTMEFTHGLNPAKEAFIGQGQGDSGIVFGLPRSGTIRDCRFIGARDCGIYANGNDDEAVYRETPIEITNNYFYRCSNALAFKRYGRDWRASGNTIIECSNGVSVQLGGGPCTIDSNTIIRTQADPIQLTGSHGALVRGNRIVDWGRWISDASTFAGPKGGEARALFVYSTSNAQVDDNLFEMRAWRPSTEPGAEHVAIRVAQRGGAKGEIASSGNSGRSNTAINVARAVHYAPGVEGNDIRFDDKIDVAFAEDLDDGALNGIVPFDGVTIRPGEPPIGFNLALPGALLTDFVAVRYTGDAQGCQIWGEVAAPDAVTVWISNETGSNVDLAPAKLLVQLN
jgi:hypothetical protein